MLKKSFSFLLLLFLGNVVPAQFPVIDALRMDIKNATTTSKKLEAIKKLLRFKNSLHTDTVAHYTGMGEELATELNDMNARRWLAYNKLTAQLTRGKMDSALLAIEQDPLLKFEKKSDPAIYYKIQLLKANVLNRKNERAAALELQLQLLKEATADNNLFAMAAIMNYTGATYYNLNEFAIAYDYWQKAMTMISAQNDDDFNELRCVIQSNLVLYYFAKFKIQPSKELADSFLREANSNIQDCEKHNAFSVLASTLSYRGNFLGNTGDYVNGEKDMKEALFIRKKIGDPLYVVNDMINLSSFYLGAKQYDSSIAVLEKAVALSDQTGVIEAKKDALGMLAVVYKTKGDYKAYAAALESFIKQADSSNKKNAAEKISEIETKYAVQKKEALIAKQQLELVQRKNSIIIAIAVSFVLLAAGLMYFIYHTKKQKQKHIAALELAEQKERKRIAAQLHDNLGVQANAILHNTSLLTTENKNIINNLQETAKDMLANLRETVWALKSTAVQSQDVWYRVLNFLRQMQQYYAHIHFDFGGKVPEGFVLSSVRALHIIMVIKESVNNAVKHADADTITVATSLENKNWIITVTDNGRGFLPEDKVSNNDTNGLLNMQERATAGNFIVHVTSAPQKGTCVTMTIQL